MASLLTPAARADTRLMLDYFLFKPYGRLGDQFASGFYYGVKFRQSLFWVLSFQICAGMGNSYTGLGELHFPVRNTPWEGERVNVRVIPITLTINLAPRNAVVTPYLCIGPGMYMLSSSMPNGDLAAALEGASYANYNRAKEEFLEGDVINEAKWPTFSGNRMGMVYGFGLWIFTESRTEIGVNFTVHRPKINLGEVRFDTENDEWVPYESTLNILLFTLSVGKGF